MYKPAYRTQTPLSALLVCAQRASLPPVRSEKSGASLPRSGCLDTCACLPYTALSLPSGHMSRTPCRCCRAPTDSWRPLVPTHGARFRAFATSPGVPGCRKSDRWTLSATQYSRVFACISLHTLATGIAPCCSTAHFVALASVFDATREFAFASSFGSSSPCSRTAAALFFS